MPFVLELWRDGGITSEGICSKGTDRRRELIRRFELVRFRHGRGCGPEPCVVAFKLYGAFAQCVKNLGYPTGRMV